MNQEVLSREQSIKIKKLWCNFWTVVGPIILVTGFIISVIALVKVYDHHTLLSDHHNHEVTWEYETDQWLEQIILVDNKTTDAEY